MKYSIVFYDWIHIATAADTPADLERILKEARAELTEDEYEALMQVLSLNQATKEMLDKGAQAAD